MPDAPEFSQPIRIADLPADQAYAFALRPDAAGCAAIAARLGLRGLRKLRFAGTLAPLGRDDWQLRADLGATVVQDCVVTLAPVTTRIDEPVARSYLAAMPDLPEGEEIAMPADDTLEPLPAVLDLGAVMFEALALALPAYPHAEGVAPVRQSYAPPGAAPLAEEVEKPFAGLAALKGKLGRDEG